MKKLNAEDLEKFLNAIAFQWLSDEQNFHKFRMAGINPQLWPDCQAKKALVEFLSVEHKGFPFASDMVAIKYKANLFVTSDLPETLDSIKAIHDENIKIFRARELAKKLQASPENADEILDNYSKNTQNPIELFEISESMVDVYANMVDLTEKGLSRVILPGFSILSEAIGGFNPQRVSILTAASGFGKTKMSINLAKAASNKFPVMFFNMEMGKTDFVSMFAQNEMKIKNSDWQSGKMFNKNSPESALFLQNYVLAKDKFSRRKPIYFTGGKSLDTDSICSSVRAIFSGDEMGFVFVDYDQKLVNSSDEEEWKAMVRAIEKFEQLAIKTNTHILILGQGNDSGDMKSSKRAIQPAATVLNFTKGPLSRITPVGEASLDEPEMFYLKAIKNRFGPHGICVAVDYDPATSTVKEIGIMSDAQKQKRRTL